MRLGVLDIGSNTGHLLVVDAHGGAAPLPAFSHKQALRLAEHLDKRGAVTRAGIDALTDFCASAVRVAEDRGCQDMLGFATSAVRDAVNSDEVLAHVRRTRALLERDAERVRTEVLPAAREGSRAGRPLALETARFGLELTEWMATWYADLEHRLLDSEPVGVPAAHRAQAIMEVLTDDVQGA